VDEPIAVAQGIIPAPLWHVEEGVSPMAKPHRKNEPNAWADDLEAGEASVSTHHPEVVQVNEQDDMSTGGSGVPVHEQRQPADPTPHNRALAIALVVVGLVIALGLLYLLATSGGA
jgi:hypothetical protein